MRDHFSEAGLRAVLGQRPFRFFEQVGSTQDIAREWAAADPDLPGGAVVIAEQQTAGRGRQGRQWLSPPDSSIMCSIIFRPPAALRAENLPRLTMVGGLAVADTLSPLLKHGFALKWPNDALIHDKKVCGILSEATWIGDRLSAVVVGVGINIRTVFTGTDLEASATSLEAEIGRTVDRRDLLAALLSHADAWAARVNDPALVEAWRGWLGTLGKRVRVYDSVSAQPDSIFSGIAQAVDDDGALLVALASDEVRRVVAADVGLAEE
jgi:BirA family biotin operon repressor/biotin-[acetyl-CoA-carboxylase] ligase